MIALPSSIFAKPSATHPYTVYRFDSLSNNPTKEAKSSSTSKESKSKLNNNNKTPKENAKEKPIPTCLIQIPHLYSTDDHFGIVMDIPGVKAQDIIIQDNDGHLKIEATRKSGENKVRYKREFALEKKSMSLGGITSSLADGVLTIKIPKKPSSEPFSITPVAMDPPPLDEGSFDFTFEIPGVKLPDLGIYSDGGRLEIIAKRKAGASSPASIMKRNYTVDDEKVDMAKASAYLMDGILTIMAPKKTIEPKSSHSIPVLIVNDDTGKESDGNNTKGEEAGKGPIVETVFGENERDTTDDVDGEGSSVNMYDQ
mmetsp:Transcript_18920/g.24339  ORF Transcript_18920/g.24339 Transcript_18920/m.24339 type:complete len:312 (-) Transcript_18920:95-1030(-)